MTAVVFSSTTPVSTNPPKVLTEMNSKMAASVPTSCAMPLLADSGSMVTMRSGVGFRIWLMSPCSMPSWLACSAPRLTCQADATVAWRSLSTRRWKSSSPSPLAGTTMAASALPPSSADTTAARSGAVATSTRRLWASPTARSVASSPGGAGPVTTTVAEVGPSFDSARLSSAMPMMATAMSPVNTKKALERRRWRISRWAMRGMGEGLRLIGRRPSAGRPRTARAVRR